jgi:hypothetical protein
MDESIIPDYIYKKGVVSITRVGRSAMRSSWRVDTADMESRIVRNTLAERLDVSVYRDKIASTLELGEYGPPEYEYSSAETREGQIILVEVRAYVRGATLSEIEQFLTEKQKQEICIQIQEMIIAHGSVVSPVYGGIGDAELSDSKCVNYMRGIRQYHICAGDRRCRIRKMRTPRSDESARLCHNSLTPDHIIVAGGRIVSVIGWSHCDFSPMQLQAASYAYMLDQQGGENFWLEEVTTKIVDVFSDKRDKMLAFCAAMYLCRLSGAKSAPILRYMAGCSE